MNDEQNAAVAHNNLGNCVTPAMYKRHEDVCPDHDEPRGECSECPTCPACEQEEERA